MPLPMENDRTREGFADFLRRLAANKVSGIEWERFIVEHYVDEMIEAARVAISRRIHERGGFDLQWSESDIAAMQHWSRKLRGAEG